MRISYPITPYIISSYHACYNVTFTSALEKLTYTSPNGKTGSIGHHAILLSSYWLLPWERRRRHHKCSVYLQHTMRVTWNINQVLVEHLLIPEINVCFTEHIRKPPLRCEIIAWWQSRHLKVPRDDLKLMNDIKDRLVHLCGKCYAYQK